MQKPKFLHLRSSKIILQLYFKSKLSFEDVQARYPVRNPASQDKHPLIEHIKSIMYRVFLDLEYELMVAGRISELQIYNSKKNDIMGAVQHLKEFISEQVYIDLRSYYRSRVRKLRINQNLRISDDKKMGIYNQFIEFAKANDLLSNDSAYKQSRPYFYLDSTKIYPSNALVTISRLYTSLEGNIDDLEKKLKEDGIFTDSIYQGEVLRFRIFNLQMLGLYRMNIDFRIAPGAKSVWEQVFRKYEPAVEQADFKVKEILLRVGAYMRKRTDPEEYQHHTLEEELYVCDQMKLKPLPAIVLCSQESSEEKPRKKKKRQQKRYRILQQRLKPSEQKPPEKKQQAPEKQEEMMEDKSAIKDVEHQPEEREDPSKDK